MFKYMDDENKMILINAMSIKNYEINEYVIRQGDNGNEIFVVYSGKLKCVK